MTDLLIVEFRYRFEHFNDNRITRVVEETEEVRIVKHGTDETQLLIRMLPLAIQTVHRILVSPGVGATHTPSGSNEDTKTDAINYVKSFHIKLGDHLKTIQITDYFREQIATYAYCARAKCSEQVKTFNSDMRNRNMVKLI